MLINDPALESIRIQQGIYAELSFPGLGSRYNDYPAVTTAPYGVCDNISQLLAQCPELEAPGREFIVLIYQVDRADEPEVDGWRWSKWGPYIGAQNPQSEYIFDEPEIEQVLCFQIFEKLPVAQLAQLA